MISFLLCFLALIMGYSIYGRYIEQVARPNPRRLTPAVKKADGVDFIALPSWKVFVIQFLNIAGTGPIFGAIMGAKFGPASYLWIVFGCIFAGAVHDYLSGILSLRHGGCGLQEIYGTYLGKRTKKVTMLLCVVILLLVGAVFVYSPAIILSGLTFGNSTTSVLVWCGIIFTYYFIATLVPIDKIIGKIYPLFALSLLFMAAALFVCLLFKWPSLPEFWDGLGNRGPSVGVSGQPIFPCLFITIACGAISGFHATQSPMMARCLKTEKLGRPVFYGAMICEGCVALIWAAVSSYFFFDGGAAEVGSDLSASAPLVVTEVAKDWLGPFGGILALMGVVAAPITTGDTALRSARLMIAETLKIKQKPIRNRIRVCLPIFGVTALMLWFNISNQDGFNTIWRYFGWANQTLSIFTLLAISVFLTKNRKGRKYLLAMLPAAFMCAVSVTFILVDKVGFGVNPEAAPWIGITSFIVSLFLFAHWKRWFKHPTQSRIKPRSK